MPVDKYVDEEDEIKDEKGLQGTARSQFSEFDCPCCSANNPCDPAIRDGDEPTCHYCGTQYLARVSDTGKLRLREL